jgi:hypothetical protein
MSARYVERRPCGDCQVEFSVSVMSAKTETVSADGNTLNDKFIGACFKSITWRKIASTTIIGFLRVSQPVRHGDRVKPHAKRRGQCESYAAIELRMSFV